MEARFSSSLCCQKEAQHLAIKRIKEGVRTPNLHLSKSKYSAELSPKSLMLLTGQPCR